MTRTATRSGRSRSVMSRPIATTRMARKTACCGEISGIARYRSTGCASRRARTTAQLPGARLGRTQLTAARPWNASCASQAGLMVMLSELRRLRLVDNQRRDARLVDLVVDLSAGDYPPVTHVLFKSARGKQMAPAWGAVTDTSSRLARPPG